MTATLDELNNLYYTLFIDEYEKALQSAVKQVEEKYPGFTIALAEVVTVGHDRLAHGGMRHVLLPIE